MGGRQPAWGNKEKKKKKKTTAGFLRIWTEPGEVKKGTQNGQPEFTVSGEWLDAGSARVRGAKQKGDEGGGLKKEGAGEVGDPCRLKKRKAWDAETCKVGDGEKKERVNTGRNRAKKGGPTAKKRHWSPKKKLSACAAGKTAPGGRSPRRG